jgi:hypothetical protein
MASGSQLSLLSRGPLFDAQILRQYLNDKQNEPIPDEDARIAILRQWISSVSGPGPTKETALEQTFNTLVLGDVLGYRLFPQPQASAYVKAPASVTGIAQEPDVVFGRFDGDDLSMMAVLELKRPGIDLDAPQPRANRDSPVEQAFGYGERILGVRWVLVSDMRLIRLYAVDSPTEFETFDLTRCVMGSDSRLEFRKLYFLLHRDYLVGDDGVGATTALLAKSLARQSEIKASFYEAYYEIRMDLLDAVGSASSGLRPVPSESEILEATQRLLDRMLFLYYCEDSPDQLIPRDTVKNVTESARSLPGTSSTKVYSALKALFREVDAGSPPTSLVRLNGYNGELFKEHVIIDRIELPDALHDKRYFTTDPDGTQRTIRGVWGLHEFDFWRELNEHLLGHIFEESLSDLVALAAGDAVTLTEKLAERKRHGIYYTTEILSDYMSTAAIRALLREQPQPDHDASLDELARDLEQRVSALSDLRIADFACGSGAFLVSAYHALLREYWTMQEGLLQLQGGPQDLFAQSAALTQARLLRDCLFGADLLPQAVEIAKLALWLRSARKSEKVADLGSNIVAADSLRVTETLVAMEATLGWSW